MSLEWMKDGTTFIHRIKNIMDIKKTWANVPKPVKEEIKSILQTFVPAFVCAVAYSLKTHGDIAWTQDALASVFLAAFRSGFKAATPTLIAGVKYAWDWFLSHFD